MRRGAGLGRTIDNVIRRFSGTAAKAFDEESAAARATIAKAAEQLTQRRGKIAIRRRNRRRQQR
jgi:hypothetical protein